MRMTRYDLWLTFIHTSIHIHTDVTASANNSCHSSRCSFPSTDHYIQLLLTNCQLSAVAILNAPSLPRTIK